MYDYLLSVIVVTYNPLWEKLRLTLNSILLQQNLAYEIIISDDGSINFAEIQGKLKGYFAEKNFSRYKFIHSEKNCGIIANCLQGVEAAEASVVKLISPGDAFFAPDTLSKLLGWMTDSQLDIVAGLAVTYSFVNDKVILHKKRQMPKNIKAYSTNTERKKFLATVLLEQNVVHGACIMVKRDAFLKYVRILRDNGVRFCEDLFTRLAVVDNCRIAVWPHNVVWYEYGEGISTSNNQTFNKYMHEDVQLCNAILRRMLEQSGNDKLVQLASELKEESASYERRSFWEKLWFYLTHYRKAKARVNLALFGKYTSIDEDTAFLELCRR